MKSGINLGSPVLHAGSETEVRGSRRKRLPHMVWLTPKEMTFLLDYNKEYADKEGSD